MDICRGGQRPSKVSPQNGKINRRGCFDAVAECSACADAECTKARWTLTFGSRCTGPKSSPLLFPASIVKPSPGNDLGTDLT
mmetsp:Transcript_102930/g.193654  ORF Transcript_102930/g.193654 Transcript_102930/m.193654 type:complete len:82 (-) Transcript_102930:630-875(-)